MKVCFLKVCVCVCVRERERERERELKLENFILQRERDIMRVCMGGRERLGGKERFFHYQEDTISVLVLI